MLLLVRWRLASRRPRSDADVLVVLEAVDERPGRERVPDILAAMAPLPCPVDLFVLTSAEFEHARAASSPFVREALAKGLDLL